MKPAVSSRTTASGARTRTMRAGAAPIAVDPITGDSEFQRDQRGAKERPPCGKPSLQHPENCGAHRGYAQEHADPGMAKQLTKREERALPWRILRRICGKPIDVERFETYPHGMWWIGKAAVDECVPEQQVAVFVMDSGNRDGQLRHKNKADAHNDEEDSDDHKRLAFREAG